MFSTRVAREVWHSLTGIDGADFTGRDWQPWEKNSPFSSLTASNATVGTSSLCP